MQQYLGVDIGGSAVKLGVVDETGRVTGFTQKSVAQDGYQTPIIESVRRAVRLLWAAHPEICGIGVSATGQIDSATGRVCGTCGNLPGWCGTDIQATLRAETHLPVSVANDGNCMCMGEAWVGAAKGYKNVICLTLGTGIGGGILSGGRLLGGAHGLAGEIGHMPTHAIDGVACTCGARGCWEQYASVSALVRQASAQNPKWNSGKSVFDAAEAGDPGAQALLSGWIAEIAAGLCGLVHLLNPELVLIGGGVSVQQKLLIDPLAAQVKASVMPAFGQGLALRAAKLRNQAGMVGAVAFLRQQRPAPPRI
ncbi:MAG: ROK family protein [Gemmiger sp.]|nr:ROK family protein [Gemmiger sp.]